MADATRRGNSVSATRPHTLASAAPSLRRAALEAACRTVAPAWPLDRQIAFSPYWGQRERPFALAAAHRQRLAGAPMTLPRAEYLRAWQNGEIQPRDLEQALREQSAVPSMPVAVQALGQTAGPHPGLPLLCDVLDAASPARDGTAWSTRVTQQISEFCCTYFDRLQADWHPDHPCGFYPGWRAALLRDRRFARLRERVAQLPRDLDTALHWAVERLAVREAQLTELFELVALRIGGWAAWCAWLRWEASLAGREDAHLDALLVTRLCWEAILHDGRHDERSTWTNWMRHWSTAAEASDASSLAIDLLWQRAQEVAYQRALFASLAQTPASAARPAPEPPKAHLVFCIDVRSERVRRAVERLDPGMRTYGFAGFFGLAIRHTPLGSALSQPRLPGLIAPMLEASESTGDAGHDRRIARKRRTALSRRASLQPFLRLPSGAFTTVEMLGLAYLPKLLARTVGRPSAAPEQTGLAARERTALHPCLLTGSVAERASLADLVAGILRGMGVRAPFGRLLVLIGHGAQTANNPQAAALACGACGGHGGEVNARILAALLNDAAVRAALAERDVRIPQETLAIAGLHDTTTDVIELLDLDRAPHSHLADIGDLRQTLHAAGAAVRRERAPSLGLAGFVDQDATLLTRLRRRAHDWSQVRPEWGLAGNAALIIAPRERSRGVDLQGRVFLHEYHWQDDRDGALLEQICAGPLLVAHWINLQYYGSTVDPERLGSGNKVLHNVVGEHIGVLEGSGGDLRIGLARQSVHDGTRWVHTPLRLSVLIDAPRERIEQVIDRQPALSALLANEWLYLYRLQEQAAERLLGTTWRDCGIAAEPTVTTHAAFPVR
ncbi:MAG: YbcC family protein [Steroidobacteraceae bacterium]